MKKLKSLTILLLEDDLNIRNDLSKILSVFFKNVISCENGSKGLKIFEEEKIDVIITDYVMPIIDGYTFTKMIRELDKKIPIIFLTNYSDKDRLLKLITMNISDFLIKPLNYDILVKSLKKLTNLIEDIPEIIILKINESINFDKNNKALYIQDKKIFLTKNELILIENFAKNVNSTISLESLRNSFGHVEKSDQAIKNIIYRLNLKANVRFLKNIQGIGYRIDNF